MRMTIIVTAVVQWKRKGMRMMYIMSRGATENIGMSIYINHRSLQTLHKTINISFKTLRNEFAMNLGFTHFSSSNACFPTSNTLQSCSKFTE